MIISLALQVMIVYIQCPMEKLYLFAQIEVLLKIFWGDAREKICEAVNSIPLDCLIMGNRGLGTIKR